MLRAAAALPAANSDVIAASINSGLIREENANTPQPLRVVNGHAFALSVKSLIPVTSFDGLAPKNGDSVKSLDLLGVRPMGKTTLTSKLSIDIIDLGGAAGNIKPDRENLRVSVIDDGVPEAMWGKSLVEGEVPPVAAEAKTIAATLGIQIAFAPIAPQHPLPPMDIEKFAYEVINKPIPWDPKLIPSQNFDSGETHDETLATIMSDRTKDNRNAVLAVLAVNNPFPLNQVDLTRLENEIGSYFQADPVLCRVGSVDEGIDSDG
jgi:hypothetical protein